MTLTLHPEVTLDDASPDAPALDSEEATAEGLRLELRPPPARLVLALLALVAAQSVVVLDLEVPVLRTGVALVTTLGLPTLVLARRLRWCSDSAAARWAYAFGISLLAVMLVSLAVNAGGLALGVGRVLTPAVLGATWLVLDIGLLSWRSSVPLVVTPGVREVLRRTWDARAEPAQLIAAVALPLAVFGAIRLNNGAGGGVALTAHLLVLVAVAILLVRRGSVGRDLRVLYLAALALLLGTSLRGWDVTGHDIQVEYGVFALTQDAGHWSMDLLQNAYTACLSITLLPAVLVELTGLSGTGWFKVGLQVVFALLPVLAYLLYRRVVPQRLALVATALVIAFPTFHADMPYLVRQEVAFLFLALALLAATDRALSVRTRRVLTVVFGIGVVVSHYSTTYLLLIALGAGMGVYAVTALLGRLGGRGARRGGRVPGEALAEPAYRDHLPAAGVGRLDTPPPSSAALDDLPEGARSSAALDEREVVGGRVPGEALAEPAYRDHRRELGWGVSIHRLLRRRHSTNGVRERLVLLHPGVLLAIVAASMLWTGPVTNTGGHPLTVLQDAVESVRGGAEVIGSSDRRFWLFGGAEESARDRMDTFVAATMEARAEYPKRFMVFPEPGEALTAPEILPEPEAPRTAVSDVLEEIGLEPGALVGLLRTASAVAIQVVLLLGLWWIVRAVRRRRRTPDAPDQVRVSPELVCVVIGVMGALGLVVVVPSLSVEYGVLRAFLQSLLLVAPVAAVGLWWLSNRLRGGTALLVAATLVIVAILTSVATAPIGGGPAKLALANTGLYYERYIVEDSDRSAAAWVATAPDSDTPLPKVLASTKMGVRLALAGVPIEDLHGRTFPTLLNVGSYLVADARLAGDRKDTLFLGGDRVTYRYPLERIDRVLDLVYSAGDSRVYR